MDMVVVKSNGREYYINRDKIAYVERRGSRSCIVHFVGDPGHMLKFVNIELSKLSALVQMDVDEQMET